jgi:transcriptional regulator with XRE-family HTH domain
MAARDVDGAANPRQVFGGMLRYYRNRAGLPLDQLGARVYMSADMVGKVEKGQRAPTIAFTKSCDAVEELGTGGALLELREMLKDFFRQWSYPGWFADWPDKEATAKLLRLFVLAVVPGLLQTEDYARAVFRTLGITDDEIDELVAGRMARQAILAQDKPPMLMALLDEYVLRRPVGGRDVMWGQINHLIEMGKRPNIVLQVIPASLGAHMGMQGAGFDIADFEGAPSVAYQDTAVRGQVIEDPEDVESLKVLWDTIRGEALPRTASLALLEDIAKTWT